MPMKATQASRQSVCRSSGAGVPGNPAAAAFPSPRRHPCRARSRRGCRCGGAAHPPLLSPRVDSRCCHTCGDSGGTPPTGRAPPPRPPRGRRQTRLSCPVPCNGGGVERVRRRPGGRRPRHGDTGFLAPAPAAHAGEGDRRLIGGHWRRSTTMSSSRAWPPLARGMRPQGPRGPGFSPFRHRRDHAARPPPSWPAQDPAAADHCAWSSVNACHFAALAVALRSRKRVPRLVPPALLVPHVRYGSAPDPHGLYRPIQHQPRFPRRKGVGVGAAVLSYGWRTLHQQREPVVWHAARRAPLVAKRQRWRHDASDAWQRRLGSGSLAPLPCRRTLRSVQMRLTDRWRSAACDWKWWPRGRWRSGSGASLMAGDRVVDSACGIGMGGRARRGWRPPEEIPRDRVRRGAGRRRPPSVHRCRRRFLAGCERRRNPTPARARRSTSIGRAACSTPQEQHRWAGG